MSHNVKIVTLGCPKNSVDTQQMKGYLIKDGYSIVENSAEADIIIVNTCSFIEDAKKESIEVILELARFKDKGICKKIIVAGCLSQNHAVDLIKEIPEADAFLGTGDIPEITKVIKKACEGKRVCCVGNPNAYLYNDNLPRIIGKKESYAYLKIAEGCDNRCSYCIIPELRGSYRSRKMEDIINEAVVLSEEGVKEIILIAQDTTLYGYDLYGSLMLPKLIKKLAQIPGISWIRILYSYPNHVTDELLNVIKNEEKICSYLDLPLQHISDPILKKMGRKTGKQEIMILLKKIRQYLPELVLRSTFIVGFPGESKEDFNELLSFLKKIRFDRAGFFAYSQVSGTKAASFTQQINKKEKSRRLEAALNLQKSIMSEKQGKQIGNKVVIMVDGPSSDYDGLWEGRTQGDAPDIDGVVYFQNKREIKVGDLVNLRITHSQEYALMGEIANELSQ